MRAGVRVRARACVRACVFVFACMHVCPDTAMVQMAPILIREFASPDEEMKKYVLKVVKQVRSFVAAVGICVLCVSASTEGIRGSAWPPMEWKHNLFAQTFSLRFSSTFG